MAGFDIKGKGRVHDEKISPLELIIDQYRKTPFSSSLRRYGKDYCVLSLLLVVRHCQLPDSFLSFHVGVRLLQARLSKTLGFTTTSPY